MDVNYRPLDGPRANDVLASRYCSALHHALPRVFGADRETALNNRLLTERTRSHFDRKSDERAQLSLDESDEVVGLPDPAAENDEVEVDDGGDRGDRSGDEIRLVGDDSLAERVTLLGRRRSDAPSPRHSSWPVAARDDARRGRRRVKPSAAARILRVDAGVATQCHEGNLASATV